GVVTLAERRKKQVLDLENRTKSKKPTSYQAGLITNTLNPQVVLLFLAFFPQYIVPSHLRNPVPFLRLVMIYALMFTLLYVLLTLIASRCSEKLKTNKSTVLYLNTVSGVVFIAMGLLIVY